MKSVLLTLKKSLDIHVDADTQYVIDPTPVFSGGDVAVNFMFDKPGVSAEIIMAYKLPKNSVLNVTTTAHHRVAGTSCLTKVRGVLTDGATSNYIGKIVIDKKAQQTSSFLQDNVLVVGNNTKNNSQPILTIEANDVKASHGATTGRIDSNQVYYLSTRGLSESEAEELIAVGFFEGFLTQIYDVSVRKKIAKTLK